MAKKPTSNVEADFKEVKKLVQNVFTARQIWLQQLLDPRKNLDAECGYPTNLNIQDYHQLWVRGDLATRVVSIFPDETWVDDPDIFETEDPEETEFEQAWKDLNDRMSLLTYLHRADILSGIGRFGIILLGIDDGLSLDQPVEGMGETGEVTVGQQRRLLYLRPLDESLVIVVSLQTDLTNPRYGQPLMYQVQFADSALENSTTNSLKVHWSRVIHIADNRANSEIFGIPRMQTVFNRLLDLRKIAGGSGEMFWKGGFPGYSLETAPGKGDEDVELDVAATQKQMTDYMNGLQRYIATVGLSVKSLSVEIADPRPHVEIQLKLIASAMAVPFRVFIGSEQAHLASTQDIATWNRRLTRRRLRYVTPFIVRPFIERLLALGILPAMAPENELCIEWPNLNTPTDTEKATVAQQETAALAQYTQAGVDTLVPPFLYLTLILGMTDEEAQAVIDAATDQMNASNMGIPPLIPPPPAPVAPQGFGGGNGHRSNAPGSHTGWANPQYEPIQNDSSGVIATLGDLQKTEEKVVEALGLGLKRNEKAIQELTEKEPLPPPIPLAPPIVNVELTLPGKKTKRKVTMHRRDDGTLEGEVEDEQ